MKMKKIERKLETDVKRKRLEDDEFHEYIGIDLTKYMVRQRGGFSERPEIYEFNKETGLYDQR